VAPIFLDIEKVMRVHRSLIERYGGLEGLRDAGLVEITRDVAKGTAGKAEVAEFLGRISPKA
jgi:hypothetical protein